GVPFLFYLHHIYFLKKHENILKEGIKLEGIVLLQSKV
ncbi:unnamed protein product, partial [Larinioides sclopetarius]